MKSAWIGFIRGDDFWERAKELADMGYKGMDGDLFRFGEDKLEENYKRFTDMGLQPITIGIHGGYRGLASYSDFAEQGLPGVIERAHKQNITKISAFSSSMIASFERGFGNNGTYDEMMADIEGMNKIADILAKEGMVLAYHNHYQEFTTIHNGVPAIYHFLTKTDPRIKFNLDTGWVTVAGWDPVEFMKQIEGRIESVHLKDIYDIDACQHMGGTFAKENDTGFTALGTGLLNVEGVVAEAARQGIEWAIVEQDRLRNLDAMQALTMARLSMLETGHFE